jgi:hypothetical protein
MTEMLKTLLLSSSLALALLLMPLGSMGPLATTGAAGLSPAHAEFGVEFGLGAGDDDEGPTVGFGIGGGDDDDEDDDEGGYGGDDDDDDDDE